MSGLDPLGRRDVREAILELNREGTTVFYSSHILGDVEAISNRVAMIIDGKISHMGTIGEITTQTGRNSLEEVLAKEVSRVVP
ncbi:MAG: lantibiotic ABC transporter ATP-binding protein, partial [Fibromonadales bacterium]|nr:lantibiotic ABC transporter ATP-binding protein [Fibromonadales bacterium]